MCWASLIVGWTTGPSQELPYVLVRYFDFPAYRGELSSTWIEFEQQGQVMQRHQFRQYAQNRVDPERTIADEFRLLFGGTNPCAIATSVGVLQTSTMLPFLDVRFVYDDLEASV